MQTMIELLEERIKEYKKRQDYHSNDFPDHKLYDACNYVLAELELLKRVMLEKSEA